MDRVDLRAWMGGSRARDEARAPVIGYRVACAASHELLQCFLDLASANSLAALAPAGAWLEPAYLRIERPFVETPDDNLVDLATVASALGPDAVRRVAASCAEAIEATGSFEPYRHAYGTPQSMAQRASEDELCGLSVPVEQLLGDAAVVEQLAEAGFDGAIFGQGDQRQWVVFSPRQVRPAIAAGWPTRPNGVTEARRMSGPGHSTTLGAVRKAAKELLGPGADALGRVIVTTSSALQQRLRGTTVAPAEALLRASTAASQDLHELMRERSARRKQAIASIGDVGDCAIVRKPGEARWMMILRDASAPGNWRTQPFDEDGFSGHMTFAERGQAIEDAAKAGFTQRDDQALDRLQDTPRFRRGLLAAELLQEHNAGEISLAEVHRRLQEHDRVTAVLASVSDQHAQALCDLQTGSIFLLADRIAAGHEEAVLFHELMHKHGRSALGTHGWGRLVGHLRAWRKAPVGSAEHLIYLAADARARRASRGDFALYDEELFSYAVEEAVLRGFKPSAQALEGSVARWLDDVESTLRGVLMQLTQKPLQPLSGQQLVDLAYAIAQMENPQRAALIQQRLGGSFHVVLDQAEALARSARRGSSASTAQKPVRMSNQAVGAAFRRLVQLAKEDLQGVLLNWGQAELSEGEDRIVSFPGRDGAFSRGAEGGRVSVSKREFLEWLASDAPFDPKTFGASIGTDGEWRGQIERLRQLAFPDAGTPSNAPATTPRQSLAPVSAATRKLLRQRGEPVASAMDAERRFCDGERLFVFHEMEDTPSEARSVLDLRAYTPDQMLALPAPQAPSLTDSPAFKAWFGDWQDRAAHSSKYPKDKTPVSMAVNDDGSPRVMFHATNADFEVFATGRPTVNSTTFGPVETERHAIFVAPEVAFAQEHLRGTAGSNVMPVYLDVKSPADLREGVPGHVIAEIVARTGLRNADFYHLRPTDTWQLFDGEFGQKVVAALKDAGYDGAILLEVSRDRQTEHEVWAAFEPSQVKSAIGNAGAFDGRDPDIRHSNIGAARDAESAGDRHYLRWKQIEVDLQCTHPVKLRLEPRFTPGVVALYSIDSTEPGSGAGSRALRDLVHLADEEGTRIELLVDSGKNEQRLMRWYAGFGFEDLGEGRMARKPGAAVTRPSGPPAATRQPPQRLAAAVQDVATIPAFRDWFEDSVVVDASGLPLPVFHGTTRSFASFSTAKLGEKTGALDARTGFFFAENPDAAAQFTWEAGEPYGGNLMPVYLRLTNPMVVRDLVLDGSTGTRAGLVMARAKAAGHDGVIFEHSDMLGRKGRAFAVFTPDQVKSVTGNRGTWSRRSSDIRLSVPAGAGPAAAAASFREWFEGSAVAEGGVPQIVFHGTSHPEPITQFEGRAFAGWFTADVQKAQVYTHGDEGGGAMYPAYLAIRRPLDLSAHFDSDEEFDASVLAGALGVSEQKVQGLADECSISDAYWGVVHTPEFEDWVVSLGFDGIKAKESGAITWAAVHADQIRSAIADVPRKRQDLGLRMSVPQTASGRRPVWWSAPRDAEFQAWFKESTVRRPVFHATSASDFHRFDTSRGDLGSHFGSLEQALHVSRERMTVEDEGARIIPVWLQLTNPLRLKDEGSFHADGIAPQLERKGLLPPGEGERIRRECDRDWRARKDYDEQLRGLIQAAGYDGVVYSNKHEGAGDSYIVFHPHQVRTAVNAWQPRPRVLAVHTYPPEGVQHPVRDRARAMKVGDPTAIQAAAQEMAAMVPAGCTLVPVPSSRGDTRASLELAQRIAAIAGVQVADVLAGQCRRSQYAAKKAGSPMVPDQMPMRLREGSLPPPHPVLVDNVAGTGETLRAARTALGCPAAGLVYAAVPGLEATHDVSLAPAAAPGRPAPTAAGTADDPFDFADDAAFHHLFYGRASAKELAEFARWLRARPDAFVRLYHGTAARNPLLDQGLLPASTRRRNSFQSANGFVCASVYPGHAHQFGVMAALNGGQDASGYRVAVYPVVTTLRRLCADLDQLRNVRAGGTDCGNSLAESLVYGHGARVRGRIEPYALRAPRMFRTCRTDEHGEHLRVHERDRLVA